MSGLTLSGGVVYADTEITNFGDCAVSVRHKPPEQSAVVLAAVVRGGLGGLSGAAVAVTHVADQCRREVQLLLQHRLGSGPAKLQGGYGILDARIGIGAPDGKWTFEIWGQNLADKGYFQVAFDAPFQGVGPPGFNNQLDSFIGDPRTFGATIRVKF